MEVRGRRPLGSEGSMKEDMRKKLAMRAQRKCITTYVLSMDNDDEKWTIE
jgi:hypothetical protein